MKTLSYTESRARYAEVLDSVVNDREEIVITHAGHEPVVIMSLADFESLRETAYLMRSPSTLAAFSMPWSVSRPARASSTTWSTPTTMKLVWDPNAGKTICGGRPRTGRC